MKVKGSVKGWSAVVVLVLVVLAGATGLRHLAAASSGSVMVANGGGPIPPSPWMNGGGPIPPSPWSR